MIIILVTSFSKNFRDHYIGNEISQIHDLQSLAQFAVYGSSDAESDINGSPASRRQARADSIGSSDSLTDSDTDFIGSTEKAELDASSNSDFDDSDSQISKRKPPQNPKVNLHKNDPAHSSALRR